MKTITHRPSFQGDLMIRRIDALPAGVVKADPTGKHHILAHSETGHHHVIDATAADRFIDSANEFIGYLRTLNDAEVKHLRDFDTHESYMLEAGAIYEVRQQREYVAEGFRRAAD